jgi:molybdate transport system substrate-binding protein
VTTRRTLVAFLIAFGLFEGRAQPAAKDEKEVLVFAAASLREAFEGLAPGFEAAHPGVKVRLNLAGSQELRTQIEQGAKADVFASADLKHMAALEKAGLVDAPAVFARNEAVIVVPRGNPAAIRGLADLPKIRRLVVGAPEVPIGGYTVKILDAAARTLGADFRKKVEASIVSRELNVKQVLAKVALGEADAGIVYRSDAQAAKDKVEAITIPANLNVVAEYPIAALKAAPDAKLARAWVALVLSADGQKRLAAAGFVTPAQASGR